MAWQYKREETLFPQINEGTWRCRIESAEMAMSKAGNDMLTLKLEVNWRNNKGEWKVNNLWNYITFLNDRPEITNRMLTAMFDSFAIEEGNFDLNSYVGKAGACVVKHDDDGRARISYFIKKDKQADLPTWTGMADVGFKEDDLEETPFI